MDQESWLQQQSYLGYLNPDLNQGFGSGIQLKNLNISIILIIGAPKMRFLRYWTFYIIFIAQIQDLQFLMISLLHFFYWFY